MPTANVLITRGPKKGTMRKRYFQTYEDMNAALQRQRSSMVRRSKSKKSRPARMKKR